MKRVWKMKGKFEIWELSAGIPHNVIPVWNSQKKLVMQVNVMNERWKVYGNEYFHSFHTLHRNGFQSRAFIFQRTSFAAMKGVWEMKGYQKTIMANYEIKFSAMHLESGIPRY